MAVRARRATVLARVRHIGHRGDGHGGDRSATWRCPRLHHGPHGHSRSPHPRTGCPHSDLPFTDRDRLWLRGCNRARRVHIPLGEIIGRIGTVECLRVAITHRHRRAHPRPPHLPVRVYGAAFRQPGTRGGGSDARRAALESGARHQPPSRPARTAIQCVTDVPARVRTLRTTARAR